MDVRVMGGRLDNLNMGLSGMFLDGVWKDGMRCV